MVAEDLAISASVSVTLALARVWIPLPGLLCRKTGTSSARSSVSRTRRTAGANLSEGLKERAGRNQVRCIEAFREPAENRLETAARLRGELLTVPRLGHAHGRSKLPAQGLLSPGYFH